MNRDRWDLTTCLLRHGVQERLYELRQQRDDFSPQLDFLEIADPVPQDGAGGLTQPQLLGTVFIFRHQPIAGIERDSPDHPIPRIGRQEIEDVGGLLPAFRVWGPGGTLAGATSVPFGDLSRSGG